MKIKNYIKKRFKYILREKYPSIYRPDSRPYISGDTLRKFSDHVFDETRSVIPENIKKNDIVFLKTDLKEIYFKNYHKNIKSEYILISHNSDVCLEESDLYYLDSKIIHWFGMKLNIESNDKISPVPSGLENKYLRANGNIKNFEEVLKNPIKDKKEKVLSSFNIHTNFQVRNNLNKLVLNDPKVDIKKFTKNTDYLNELSSYKYNLCPEGNNFESHRIWESLIFGVTPIVLKNHVNNNFHKLGVPLLIIDSWEELRNLSIEDLDDLNKENFNKEYKIFSMFNYWKDLINSKKI